MTNKKPDRFVVTGDLVTADTTDGDKSTDMINAPHKENDKTKENGKIDKELPYNKT